MGLNIGLVGHGRWGRRHLETLIQLKGEGKISHISVCDIDANQLRTLPPEVDATFTEIADLLAHKTIDCIAIVTPPNTHLELTFQAMKYNLPVFVEKPLSDQLGKEADFLTSINPDKTLVTGFLLRHHNGIKAMKELLDDNVIGSLQELHYYRTTKRNRPEGAEAMGTLAVHGFDLSVFFEMKEMVELEPHEFINQPIEMRLDTRGPRQKRLLIDVSWNSQQEQRKITLIGKSGELSLTFGPSPKLTHKTAYDVETITFSNDNSPLYCEWDFFLNAVLSSEATVYPSTNELLLLNQWVSFLTR